MSCPKLHESAQFIADWAALSVLEIIRPLIALAPFLQALGSDTDNNSGTSFAANWIIVVGRQRPPLHGQVLLWDLGAMWGNKINRLRLTRNDSWQGRRDGWRQKLYREFSAGFFDLIVIDECHRGSAAEDSAWREILDHFSAATQIGLTATPKETAYVSNIHYFGKPVYSYSLKQGIQDGFLAPYKVIKVHIDVDIEGYRPEPGKTDRDGNEVEDRIYNQKDFDRTLVIDDRTKLVAAKVSEFLKESGDRFQKTIVFCVDEEHAARMRSALVNENKDLCDENHRYVMRITGSDTEGQAELGNFIDPESKYPVPMTSTSESLL